MPTMPQPTPPEATRPGDFGPSLFASTNFDALAPTAVPYGGALPVFDVCHVGVVLRAVLFVHAVLAVGVLFVSHGFGDWLNRVALGAGMALPGVLLWLLGACLLQRPLAQQRESVQAAAAATWGAASGLGGWAVVWLAGLDVSDGGAGPTVQVAAALAGAGIASVVYQWLRLRAQAQVPADTTARLAELQSRIRPHFLFNTLNTALSLVRLDPARAEGVLEDLAELFRVALADTGASVSLADEVELAQRYLAIEQIRFGPRLKLTWELDPAAALARMPPLLLQPLVENAVRHGVEPAEEGGAIRVRTRVKLGRAVISIDNTTHGGASVPGHGIALANVRERLRLMHDVAAQFETHRDHGVFRVQIVVPL